jgi:hypothetical protein
MLQEKYQRIIIVIALIFFLGLTYFAYQPGLSGPFVFDDGPNILRNSDITIQDLNIQTLRQATFSGTSGPFGRPISMLSFALNFYMTGFNNYYFKLTNLFIHMLCGIGIFFLSSTILQIIRMRTVSLLSARQSDVISLAVTAAWLLHPLGLTSVLYVVQRMTSLSSLFCILGLYVYLRGRIKLIEGKSGRVQIVISLLVFTPLAMLSKEIGALLPLFFLVTEISLLHFETKTRSDKIFLILFFTLCIAIPATGLLIFGALHPSWLLNSYTFRDFTLLERVMTESRVIFFYLRLIFLPSISKFGLYHDDITYSHSLIDPLSTIAALCMIVAALMTAIVIRKKAPVLSFGILFFFAGHVLESSIFALEIAHEHRNYLPMFAPVFAAIYYLLIPFKTINILQFRHVVCALLILCFAIVTHARSKDWANPFDLYSKEVEHHPNSSLANLEMGTTFGNIESNDPIAFNNNYTLARSFYEKAAELNPNSTVSLIDLIILTSKRQYEIEPKWIKQLQDRLEHSPFAANTPDQLIALLSCKMDGACQLSKNQLSDLLQASLRNPLLSSSQRAATLSSYSFYLVNIEQDYLHALQVMLETIKTSPQELEYRMTFINFAIAIGHFDNVKDQLDELKRLDSNKKYSKAIESKIKTLQSQ